MAVAASSRKEPLFGLEQRIMLARQVLGDVPEIEVVGYEKLTVDVAQANDVGVIVRGLRAVSDFEYEFQLATMNRHLNEAVETVFMTPSEDLMFISSTQVREIARMGTDVSQFVHPKVNEALKQRFAQ